MPVKRKRTAQRGKGLGSVIKSLIKKVKDMFKKPTKEEWMAQNRADYRDRLEKRLARQNEIDRRNQGYTSHTGPASRQYDPDFVGGRRKRRVIRRRR